MHDIRGPPIRPASPIYLPHLIRGGSSLAHDTIDEESQEDIFGSAIALLEPKATSNQHGDPGTAVLYNGGSKVGQMALQLSDPGREQERWLFAHYVWNAGLLLAECLGKGWWYQTLPKESRTRNANWSVVGQDVLELGAGTGLAGLCSVMLGAHRVHITDYPTDRIISTLEVNAKANIPSDLRDKVSVQGHEWGDFDSPWAIKNASSFETILAADTLWIDSAHAAQAESMRQFLKKDAAARIWIVAGFHTGRPKVRHFIEEELPQVNLGVLDCWEIDVAGNERAWDGKRQEGFGDGARWSVVAIIGWQNQFLTSLEQP